MAVLTREPVDARTVTELANAKAGAEWPVEAIRSKLVKLVGEQFITRSGTGYQSQFRLPAYTCSPCGRGKTYREGPCDACLAAG